ncbi:MAG: hypothetical protein ACRC92_20215 [Peptostreptococcaceae bacterium]
MMRGKGFIKFIQLFIGVPAALILLYIFGTTTEAAGLMYMEPPVLSDPTKTIDTMEILSYNRIKQSDKTIKLTGISPDGEEASLWIYNDKTNPCIIVNYSEPYGDFYSKNIPVSREGITVELNYDRLLLSIPVSNSAERVMIEDIPGSIDDDYKGAFVKFPAETHRQSLDKITIFKLISKIEDNKDNTLKSICVYVSNQVFTIRIPK